MSITKQIKCMGREIGLDIVRITNADIFPQAEREILKSIEKGYIVEGTEHKGHHTHSVPDETKLKRIRKRCNPKNILRNAKSVISVAYSYAIEDWENKACETQPCGKIAKYDVANFYLEVKEKLQKIIDFINQKYDFKYKSKNKSCYVSLVEKPIACRSGVGWYGKNGIITTEKFGSWVVLGEIITELELEIDKPLQNDCGSCHICMDACPTNAIVAPYTIDRTKCLQYISERMMDVPLEYRDAWGDSLYGCTTCQDVCPINLNKKLKRYRPPFGYIGSKVPLLPLLEMSQNEFNSFFENNQIAMRPMDAIKRNAVLVLGNIRNPIAIKHLNRVLQEEFNTILRGHAAWALGKINGLNSKKTLEKALKLEENELVIAEIKNALKKF